MGKPERLTVWVPADDRRVEAAMKALEVVLRAQNDTSKIAALMTANNEIQKIVDDLLFRHL